MPNQRKYLIINIVSPCGDVKKWIYNSEPITDKTKHHKFVTTLSKFAKTTFFFTVSLCKHLKQTRFCLPYYKSCYEGLWFKVTEQNLFSFLRPCLKEWIGWTFQFLNSSSKNLESRWKFNYPGNCFLLYWFLQRYSEWQIFI